MARRTSPPFRADHVGSLLRPQRLLQAREDFAAGRIPADELRSVEDGAIPDVVRMQEDVGLQSATDGEFRRASWHMDFIYRLGGVGEGAGEHGRSSSTTPPGTSSSPRRADPRPRQVGLDDTIFGGRLRRSCERRHHGGAQADHPVAEHGPLPGRPGLDRPGGLPGHRGVLVRPGRGLRRRGAQARRARLHLPAVRRHAAWRT